MRLAIETDQEGRQKIEADLPAKLHKTESEAKFKHSRIKSYVNLGTPQPMGDLQYMLQQYRGMYTQNETN